MMISDRTGRMGLCTLATLVFAGTTPAVAQDVVNVYSSRHYDTDLALYERFTEQTGIEVNLIEGGSDELIQRLLAEGENSPADLLITVDAGRLWRADQEGLFQPTQSDVLESRVPTHLRHPDGHWFGLSKRARAIFYRLEDGAPEGLDSYEDLADPAFRDMVCIRSSSNIYNQSLLASIIAAAGEEVAAEWAAGVVENFAREPEGNDTAQLRAIAAGECPLGVANSYYFGRLLASDDPADVATGESLGIIFPNQDDRGTHVNVSGAGILAHSPHPEAAVAFLEYLVSDDAQILFADGNNEFPVVETVTPQGPIAAYADFVEDTVNADLLGENNPLAVRVFDQVGWP